MVLTYLFISQSDHERFEKNGKRNRGDRHGRAARDAGRQFAGSPAAQAPAGEPDPFIVLENLRRENAELKDKVLRALAEMENQRRRTEREVADAKNIWRDLVCPRYADVRRQFAPRRRKRCRPDAREEAGAALKILIEGIELTERDFLSRLGKYGIKKLDPLGVKFDPNLHEALFEVPDETVPHGTVVQVIEDGYAIGDRVLRPAKVGVSRGGPKPANENAPT